MIDGQVLVGEDIEYDLPDGRIVGQEAGDGPHRDLGGPIRRETKDAGGDAAKGQGPHPVLHGQLQTGLITARQKLAVACPEPPGDNRPDRMQNIPAGEVIPRRNLGGSRRFRMPLRLHDFVAGQPKLNA